MTITESGSQIEIGQVVVTSGVMYELPPQDVLNGLVRHINGDWGELCEQDREENDHAANNGGRLMSRYTARTGAVFWIITEYDRSVTTILLPLEY